MDYIEHFGVYAALMWWDGSGAAQLTPHAQRVWDEVITMKINDIGTGSEELDSELENAKDTFQKYINYTILLVNSMFDGKIDLGSKQYKLNISDEIDDVTRQILRSSYLTSMNLVKIGFPITTLSRDTLILSRCILEHLINASYVLAEGQETAENAKKFALQAGYREMDKRDFIGGWSMMKSFSGKPDVSEIEGLQDALDQFTKANGKPIFEWDSNSIRKRIEIISECFPKKFTGLALAYLNLYSKSSEIIHGTFYGSLLGFGWPLNLNEKGMRHQLGIQTLYCLTKLIFAYDAFFKVFASAYEVDAIAEASDKIFVEYNKKIFSYIEKQAM